MGRKAREQPRRLAEKLLQIRQSLGLSQSQMLRKLRKDKNRNFISDYENGVRVPGLLELLDYARAAGVSIDVLVDDNLDLPGQIPPPQEVEGVMKQSKQRARARRH